MWGQWYAQDSERWDKMVPAFGMLEGTSWAQALHVGAYSPLSQFAVTQDGIMLTAETYASRNMTQPLSSPSFAGLYLPSNNPNTSKCWSMPYKPTRGHHWASEPFIMGKPCHEFMASAPWWYSDAINASITEGSSVSDLSNGHTGVVFTQRINATGLTIGCEVWRH